VSRHPKLTEAMNALDQGRGGPIVAIAARARLAAEAGEYCECEEPDLIGADLMCGACLRNNKGQERRAVRRLVEHHVFVQGRHEGFCDICVGPEAWSRHQGVDGIGRTSWGEDVRAAL